MKNIFALSWIIFTGFAVGEVTVSVAGLQVVGDGYQGKEEGENAELRAFNWSEGTQVSLLFKSEGKGIVKIDEEATKLTVFKTDQGTNFLKAKSRFSRGSFHFDLPRTSEDKKALITTLATSAFPKQGAKEIQLEGEVLLMLASQSELKKSEKVALEIGEKLVVGEESFELSQMGKSSWGGYPLEITLKSGVDHESFKAFRFFDGEGKEIASEQSGNSSFGRLGKRTYSVTYRLKSKPTHLVLGLDAWSDLEEVQVPFSFKLGVGL